MDPICIQIVGNFIISSVPQKIWGLVQFWGLTSHIYFLFFSAFICKLTNEPKEQAISQLLNHLPLLHSGNAQAKTEYIKLIPIILSHSIEKGVFIEESRQLLSYSLIHPAITSDERSKFNMWLGHLEEHFSNYHSPNQVQGQTNEKQGQCYSQLGDNGISQKPHMTLTKANSIGSGRLNGCWNTVNANANNVYNSSESMNVNGVEGQGQSDYNAYGPRQQVSHRPVGTSSGHMPLQPTRSAPANFTTMHPPPSTNSQSKYIFCPTVNVLKFQTPNSFSHW